jgi:ATP-dependent protease ClpP protease subunit
MRMRMHMHMHTRMRIHTPMCMLNGWQAEREAKMKRVKVSASYANLLAELNPAQIESLKSK